MCSSSLAGRKLTGSPKRLGGRHTDPGSTPPPLRGATLRGKHLGKVYSGDRGGGSARLLDPIPLAHKRDASRYTRAVPFGMGFRASGNGFRAKGFPIGVPAVEGSGRKHSGSIYPTRMPPRPNPTRKHYSEENKAIGIFLVRNRQRSFLPALPHREGPRYAVVH